MIIWFALLLAADTAHALPAPPKTMDSLQQDWTELRLKVDLRNLTGPSDSGRVDEDTLRARLAEANRIWSQCSIRFNARSASNVSAEKLQVPYAPRSQDDLSRIAAALNPSGFEAIPVTVAGPWTFFDGGARLYLTGLGWVFTRGDGIDRIGAMISSTKLQDPSAGPIIAHEIAHALSLPHTADRDNLMGEAGTNLLTPSQCVQARSFSQTSLKNFLD